MILISNMDTDWLTLPLIPLAVYELCLEREGKFEAAWYLADNFNISILFLYSRVDFAIVRDF